MIDIEIKRSHIKDEDKRNFLVLGEPMCVYKTYIREHNLEVLNNANINLMPFSEVLLFHMIEIDRKHQFKKRLDKWIKLHDEVMKTCGCQALYTDIARLQSLAKDKLNFCIGDAGKYRFAKLLSLNKDFYNAVILLNSSEENTAIILKQLLTGYRNEINIPLISLDLDYEHKASKEDFEIL